MEEKIKKTSAEYAYRLGRLVAMVMRDNSGEIADVYPSLCAPGHASQTYSYWLRKALEKGAQDLTDLYADLSGKGADAPWKIIDPTGAYWIGYYHQRGADTRGAADNGQNNPPHAARV